MPLENMVYAVDRNIPHRTTTKEADMNKYTIFIGLDVHNKDKQKLFSLLLGRAYPSSKRFEHRLALPPEMESINRNYRQKSEKC